MANEITQKCIIKKVSNYFGGNPSLARALGINVRAIYQWDSIPESRAYQIEVLTNGHFKAEDLIQKITNNS
jgi:transcriptional repressor of cell division inhibition gene dicB